MSREPLTKPAAFQDVFKRKPGTDQMNTHYCPGCGHGIVHKLIAEGLSDLGLQDRAILAAPVGCAVFLYYYFGCCSTSVAHGRAPAALTGISRAHDDAVVISYQGDGDLAAIGTNNIIHAANRGEKMAVFFVNNAIYGMTGGQMAPTTLIGMKTATSPMGRTAENEGHPLAMSEIISTLQAPIYVERVALDSPADIMRTRKAIRKSLTLQAEKKGFTFVEILSPCPTNWKVPPDQTGEWMREHMMEVFKPGVFKDISADATPRHREQRKMSAEELYELMGVPETDDTASEAARAARRPTVNMRFAGFGGQGVLLLGILAAQTGMMNGRHVAWMPSYGPEMRGGTANSSVILSDEPIGSPVVSQLDALIAMNAPSLQRFIGDVRPGGVALYNRSIVDTPPENDGSIALGGVPATEIATDVGEVRTANTVMLGAYAELTGEFDNETLDKALAAAFPKESLVEVNRRALEAGAAYAANELA